VIASLTRRGSRSVRIGAARHLRGMEPNLPRGTAPELPLLVIVALVVWTIVLPVQFIVGTA
jgi:hypothetical protein